MTEQLGYVEEVTYAATEIENAFGARQIEFDLANPPDVDPDPTIEVEIFWPVGTGVSDGVSLSNLFETGRINCFNNPPFVKREPASSEEP